jgi:hypothetical protein
MWDDKTFMYSIMIDEFFDTSMTRVFAHCIRMNMQLSIFLHVSVLYCPSKDDRIKALHDLSDGQWVSIRKRALEWRRRMNTFYFTRQGRNLIATGTRSVIANIFRDFQVGESMQDIKCTVDQSEIISYELDADCYLTATVSNSWVSNIHRHYM